MPPIKIAVQHPPVENPDYVYHRNIISRLDDLGVDVIFGYDHFFVPQIEIVNGEPQFNNGVPQITKNPKDLPNFESWTTLAAWAEQTKNAELGLLVTGIGYRNPDLLADMARTVDHISDGRLILGVGAGWLEKDYTEYDYDFGTFTTRFQLFEEGLARIKARFAKLNPPPVHDIPILIGGGGEKKTLPLVAKYADIWHVYAEISVLEHKNALLDKLLEQEGRSHDSVIRSTGYVEDTATNDAFVDAGFTLLVIQFRESDTDYSKIEAALAWRDQHNK